MNDRIRHLMDQIESLESELNKALQEQQVHLSFKIKGKQIEFASESERSYFQFHRDLVFSP